MSDPSSLPTYPHAARANEIGMRQGPMYTRSTSGFAVASFAFGLIGGFVLSVIFGIIALGRTGPHGQRGRWMAVTGLTASGLWLVGILAAVVFFVEAGAERNEAGEIVTAGNVATFDLQAGDCLSDLSDDASTDVPAVPCSEPHEGEVFGVFELELDDYPARNELDAVVGRECADVLARYVGAGLADLAMDLYFYYPEERSWPEDREVVCIAASSSSDRTGSLADL